VGFSARGDAPAEPEAVAEAPPAPEPAPPEPEPEPEPAPRHPWQRPQAQQRPEAPRPEGLREHHREHPRDQHPRETHQGQRQTVSLRSHITGLHQVVWLQRANGRDTVTIEVTPGTRYDPAIATVLALEPIVLQIAGGLHARDFERVSSWAIANRDLIDAFWEGELDSFEDVVSRVRKVPGPGADRWRG
jgi:hypothetical protein